MIGGVHRGDHRKEDLCGADIARGALATDVLLAGLERETVGRLAFGIDGHTHQPSGQGSLQSSAHTHEAGVRPAESHGHAEALGRADADIRAHFTGGRQQGEGQQVGGDDGADSALARSFNHGADITHLPG